MQRLQAAEYGFKTTRKSFVGKPMNAACRFFYDLKGETNYGYGNLLFNGI